MKLCKDCKHTGGTNGNVCIRRILRTITDYVYGQTTEALGRFCNDERKNESESESACGFEAKYFESKDGVTTA